MFGIANGAVAAVLHGTIFLDVANGRIAVVLDRSVAFDITDGGIASVLDGSVVFNVTDSGIAAVLYRPIFFDVTDGRVAAVLYGAVFFDIALGAVAAVLNGLGIAKGTEQNREEYNCFFHILIVSRRSRRFTRIIKDTKILLSPNMKFTEPISVTAFNPLYPLRHLRDTYTNSPYRSKSLASLIFTLEKSPMRT